MIKPLTILLASVWIVNVSSLSECGTLRRPILDDSSRKRLLEHCSALQQPKQQQESSEGDFLTTITASRRRVALKRNNLDADEYDYPYYSYLSQEDLEIDALHLSEQEGEHSCDVMNGNISPTRRPTSTSMQVQVQLVNRVKLWPPWPLNLLAKDRRKQTSNDPDGHRQPVTTSKLTAKNTYPSAGALFWVYLRQRTRVGLRQLQQVSSQLWFHLPPAAPPLILWSCLPRKINIPQPDTTTPLTKRILPIWNNTFARNLALTYVGFAILSWAHMEVHHKRRLTPLPLTQSYERGVSKVFLPPVLPEDVPESELQALNHMIIEHSQARKDHNDQEEEEEDSETQKDMSSSLVSTKLKQHLAHIYEKRPSSTLATTWRKLQRIRAIRRLQAAKIRRLTIFDELVALQALKRQSARYRRQQLSSSSGKQRPGYALVTGASQGIGRAIAIELARWEIPLILVARDVDRLTSLAYDLEACYGVQCCVLQADLAKVDAAENIYQTTHEAGLPVDILINNAGIAYDGLAVDMDISMVERMIMLNAMTYAKLSKLYGQDMKRNRRGRILMVSSMSGISSASPNSAMYGATKAFEKYLGLSMAKEMEPYGVGVTCLMPGPVVETQFRDRSGTGKALCWHLPYYPRPAQFVAHIGVMSMLDGDTQAIPGWQNRAFVKILQPIIPQRVEIMAVQAAWSPFKIPLSHFFHKQGDNERDVLHVSATEAYKETRMSPPADLKKRYKLQLPPRLLKLPSPEPEPKPPQIQEPEPSAAELKPPDHEDEGSSSSRVRDPIDHLSIPPSGETIELEPRNSASGQKVAQAPVEESQKQSVEPSISEREVTEKRVETIEKKQDGVPTSKPGDAVDQADNKKETAEIEKPRDNSVEKSATRRPEPSTWMDNDKWGGLSPRLGSTDNSFERRLRLLNRKGVEATNDLERQFLA
jgi:short-subunit dehydrogenase